MIVGGDDEAIEEIVRCRHPGCDLFFNNGEEVAEHIKREHTDEVSVMFLPNNKKYSLLVFDACLMVVFILFDNENLNIL